MVKAVLQRPRERAPYQPFGASRIAWRSRRTELLLCGPADTGKSRGIIEKLHYCADKYSNARILMVRKTRKSLGQTAMVTYEKKVLPQGWLGSLIRFNTTDQQYEYPNGSIIAVGGMDNPEKVLSSEWDMIYPQEATELSENSWEILGMRLRNGFIPYQQLIGDCNPGSPTHWLKRRCDQGLTYLLNSRHEDNPSITPERIARLDALTGVRYLRYRKGIWAAAEGMVYDEWDSAVHKVSKQQLVTWGIFTADGKLGPAVKAVHASVDWGYTNPGVVSVWAIDGDRRMYLIHEIYQTRKTDDWWVIRGRELRDRYGIRHWFCDPAEPAYIEKFRMGGLDAIGAVNDIAPGINKIQGRLKIAGDGRPRLYVYEFALQERDESLANEHAPVCSEDEILEYIWPIAQDGKSLKEVPVDANNHAMDTWRYMAMYLDGGMPSADKHLDTMKQYLELLKAGKK
jgi:phage terminase large subunit